MTELEQMEAELAKLEARQAPAPAAAAPTELQAMEAELAGLESKAPKEKEAWYEDFGEGLGVSGLETYYGAKDLIGQMDDEDRATLKDWQDDAGESGWGTAGQVVGDVGQFFVPGGAALKGVKALSKAKKYAGLGKTLALMGGEGAAAGALGALKLPEAGETRLGNAATDAAFGVVGSGAGSLLSKTMKGLNKSKAGQKLLDEGVDLTPGQMTENAGVRGLETVMEVTPFLARGTKEAKKRGLQSWNKKVMQEAAPAGATIDEIGPAGAKQMKEAVKSAYDDAWKGAGKLNKGDAVGMIKTMERSAGRLGKADNRALTNVMNDIVEITEAGSLKGNQSIDDILRRAIKSAGKDKHELTTALERARAGLRKRLPVPAKRRLAKIDKKYPGYLTVRDAVGRAKQTDGMFTPAQLTTSVGKVGKGKAEVGEAALQEASDIGRSTLGAKEGGQPLEWFRRVAGAVPSPPGMEFAGRTLMGQTSGQKAISKMLENPRVAAMREIAAPGAMASYSGQ